MPNGSCTITRAVIFQKVIDIYRKWKIWIELPCDFYREKTCRFLPRRNTRYRVLCARRNIRESRYDMLTVKYSTVC